MKRLADFGYIDTSRLPMNGGTDIDLGLINKDTFIKSNHESGAKSYIKIKAPIGSKGPITTPIKAYFILYNEDGGIVLREKDSKYDFVLYTIANVYGTVMWLNMIPMLGYIYNGESLILIYDREVINIMEGSLEATLKDLYDNYIDLLGDESRYILEKIYKEI